MKIFGLVGRNISYSFSRSYFSEKFKKEAITNCEYINFDIKSIDFFKEKVAHYPNLSGLNVTIPYKEQIIPFLDELDVISEKINAVNTIKILPSGKLKGYNTDYYGFSESVKPLLKSYHKKALILGTGGASKAVAFALSSLGIDVLFVSRTPENEQISYDDITSNLLEGYTIIINCTPLGTSPQVDLCPEIPYNYLSSKHLLYDLIYNPSKTLFLEKGERQGAAICNGYQMLVLQAEASWRIWNNLELI